MNEREQFLQRFQSFFTAYVHRVQKMNETQVLNGLRAMKATRNSYREELAFLNSVSLAPTEDLGDEINKLRRQLSSRERAGLNPFFLLDYIEDALKDRLETLRRNPRSNS
jgi:uncharacterized coiled-coil DUF342 family protein